MACIRTSVSLISFGFSIYKFYLAKAEQAPAVQHQRAIKIPEQDQDEKYESLERTFAVVVSILGLGLLGVVMLQL